MGIFSSIAGIIGGAKKAKAATKAATAQIGYLDKGVGAVQSQQQLVQQQLHPAIAASDQARQSILNLLGLGGTAGTPGMAGTAGGPVSGPLTPDQVQQIITERPDVLQEAQRTLADGSAQQRGANDVNGYVDLWYNTIRHEAGDTYELAGAPGAATAGTPGISANDAQQSAIDQLMASPLFKSLTRNGENSILSNGSATGGLRGGNIQRSLADFSADTLASVIQQQLGNLGGLTSQGLQAILQGGQLGNQSAGQVAELFGEQGTAKAGGILGKALGQSQMWGAAGGLADQVAAAAAGAAGAPTGSSGAGFSGFMKGLF